jgi:3',5'-cyclic AMP phosphodiesterase CpdA
MALTWLHLSDFHIRMGDSYDRDVVLGALVRAVRRFRERGRSPDVVFATGDVAFSGKSGEYEIATAFFDEVLDAAGLERRDLFVISGNHDVDRDLGVGLARSLASREEADKQFSADFA